MWGGLAAVYPAYQESRGTSLQNEQREFQVEEARNKILGAQVLGRALFGDQAGAGGPPPGQPMAPSPGQPSVPNAAPAMAPPAGPAPMAAPPGPPPGAGVIPQIDLTTLAKRIVQTTPQAAQNPAIMLAALERAAPILDRQSREDLAELRREFQTKQLELRSQVAQAQADAAQRRLDQGERRLDQGDANTDIKRGAEQRRTDQGNRRLEQGDRRLDQGDTREARMAAQAQVRQDQGWQRLELQKQDFERRVREGGDRTAIAQWRAVVDAQAKRAREILGANSVTSMMRPEDRKALLDEQDKFYRSEIERMRGMAGATTPTGSQGPSTTPKTDRGAPPPAAPLAPPVSMLKQGTVTTFANGQRWTIGPDGQPQQVP